MKNKQNIVRHLTATLCIKISILLYLIALILDKDKDKTDYQDPGICRLGETYNLYALQIPVILVWICNGFVLVKGIAITWRATSQKLWNNYKKAKKWLRSCIVLFFLLGMYWILAIIAAIPELQGVL